MPYIKLTLSRNKQNRIYYRIGNNALRLVENLTAVCHCPALRHN